MELFGALAIIKDAADEVSVKLFTGETTGGAENSRSRWGSCCGSSKGAAVAGINLDVRFDASIHDRSIVANSGWHMHLGRGLDIFQFVPNDAFNVASRVQGYRQVKAFGVTYIRETTGTSH